MIIGPIFQTVHKRCLRNSSDPRGQHEPSLSFWVNSGVPKKVSRNTNVVTITQKCFNKRDKFLWKRWCCVSGRGYRLDTVKSFKADVSSVSPSSGRRERSANARTSALKLLTVANLSYQPSWQYQITLFKKSGHSRARTHEWGISSQKSRELKAITPTRFSGVKDG